MTEPNMHRKLVKFQAENGKQVEVQAVYEVGYFAFDCVFFFSNFFSKTTKIILNTDSL